MLQRQRGRHFKITFACAYNLFAHRVKTDLYCAVPEDCPVPPSVDGRWRFAGRLADAQAVSGFRDSSARCSARRKGYVLFFAGAKGGPRALAA
jgi:hypothetical protein